LGTFHWDLFATLTYRWSDPPSLPAVRRSVGELFTDVHAQRLAWFAERGKVTYRAHVHALLSFHDDDCWSRHAIDSLWRRKYGIARIEPYDASQGASGYCAKYLTKRHFDWDFLTGPGRSWHS
jgi:hypothetical protein